MNLLKKLTNELAKQWTIVWFLTGVSIVSYAFWETTERGKWDIFYLSVSIIGLLCVVSLSFRKNMAGNGLGITANVGEVVTQAHWGATGLLLAPVFYLCTHLFGLVYWAKNQDGDGNMIPKSATKLVWVITLSFIILGLFLFPVINNQLKTWQFIDNSNPAFYWVNVLAFVLGVTAQTCMILRYSFSWWLWGIVNFVWLAVNMMTENYIFACQTIVYQINVFIGLYEWYSQEKLTVADEK